MNNAFSAALLRLKAQLGLHTDREVAELLGMGEKAFNARKTRGSFPSDKLYALQSRRPDLRLDADYVLTGQSAAPLAAPIDVHLHALSVEAVLAELGRRGATVPDEVKPRLYKAVHDMSLPGPTVNARAVSALLDVALSAATSGYGVPPASTHATTFHGQVGTVHSVHEGKMTVVHGARGAGKSKPPKGG